MIVLQTINRNYKLFLFVVIPFVFTAFHFNIFFTPPVGIHVWRQTQTLATARSFFKEDANILNPRMDLRGDGNGIVRLEFPLFQWLLSLLYRAFGEGVIIFRIYCFLISLLSLLGMAALTKAIFKDNTLSIFCTWAFTFSPLFYYYSFNPLPDILALSAAIWSLFFTVKFFGSKRIGHFIFSISLLGSAAAVKLPFILFYFPLTCYLIFYLKETYKKKFLLVLSVAISLAPALAWYAWVMPQWQGEGIAGVHGTIPNGSRFIEIVKFFIISLLPESLLNYAALPFFLVGTFIFIKKKVYTKPVAVCFLVLGFFLILYFIVEVDVIEKVHDYYFLPFLPLLFLSVAYGIKYFIFNKKLVRVAIVLLAILPLTAFLRMHHRWNIETPGFNRDILVHQKELKAAVPKDALCVAGNDISGCIFFYYLDKRGWSFYNDELNQQKLEEMISKGATFLYSDSRAVDNNPDVRTLFEREVLSKGTVRLFKLRSTN